MYSIKEYLMLYKLINPSIHEKDRIIEYNKALCDNYPFLIPRNRWTDEIVEDYDYTYTELDAMPEGWRIAFSEDFLRGLKEELDKFDFVDKYRIIQIKEKYGGLRWYGSGVHKDSHVYNIINKYCDMSYRTCIKCGAKAVWQTKGWIEPYCQDCAMKFFEKYKELTSLGIAWDKAFERIED